MSLQMNSCVLLIMVIKIKTWSCQSSLIRSNSMWGIPPTRGAYHHIKQKRLRDLPKRKVNRKVQALILRITLRLAILSERQGPRSSIINKLTVNKIKIVAAEALHKQTKRMSRHFASIKTRLSRTNISIIQQVSSLNMTMDPQDEVDRESFWRQALTRHLRSYNFKIECKRKVMVAQWDLSMIKVARGQGRQTM